MCALTSSHNHRPQKDVAYVVGDMSAELWRKTIPKVFKITLSKYPKKEGMGWPTYLLVSNVEEDFNVHGEIKGGMPKGDFRKKLSNLISTIN